MWERELDINGKVMPAGKDSYGYKKIEVGEKNYIPFRFQGQYEDEEIGLYYNRFRYYDPEIKQYTQQDPIGLAGGNPTLYGYVWDTNWEMDPFGLKPFELKPFGSVRAALRYAKQLAGIPRSQQPVRQWIVTEDIMKYSNKNYVVSFDKGTQGRYYEFVNAKGHKRVVVLHTNDPRRSIHAHAGMPKPYTDPYTYDFKDPKNRYMAIDDVAKKKDHHIDIDCKG